MVKPNYISCHRLTPAQLHDIENLAAACQEAEGMTLSFPADVEEDSCYPPYHLLYENGLLVSAFSLLPMDENTWEAMAMTLPSCRRKGYMNLLFDHAYDDLCAALAGSEESGTQDPDIAFYTDLKSADALRTLQAMECEYWYSELMMSLIFPWKPETVHSQVRLSPKSDPASGLTTYQALLDGVVIGTCCILDFSQWYYLYGLEIYPDYRGKGFGKAFLYHILESLDQKNHRKVKLQVHSQNSTALTLYEKTGFREDDRIDYYLY